MSDCCTPKGYRQIFSRRSARSEAKRYRRHGLDPTSRSIVEFLKRYGVDGLTLLEVGGGIGAIQIELLKAGAAQAVSVELTPTYEEAAVELLREAGLEDRVERRVMDFTEAGGEVKAAGVVVLNRVICCYPDMPKLAGAAASHAQRVLVMSFPRDTWWMRLGLGLANFGLWIARRQFHIFVHSPDQILAIAKQHGLRTTLNRPGVVWQIAALERVAA